MSSIASQYARTVAGASSTQEGVALLLRKDNSSKPLLIAVQGEDSLAYAAALVDGGGPAGVYAPLVPEQRPSIPNQPCLSCPRTDSTAFANQSPFNFKTPLPMSLEYGRQVAERLYCPHEPLPCQLPCGARSISVRPVEKAQDQIQDELRTLARWLRLRGATLPPLPPPMVGDIDSDPSGVADRYGMKGKHALTAFINIDEFSCRVCAFTANTLQLAIRHQQQARHYQA